MRRAKEPWYRKFNDTWYVWHDGKQVPLAKGKHNKEKAFETFYRLMAGHEVDSPSANSLAAITIVDLFLDHQRFNGTTSHRSVIPE